MWMELNSGGLELSWCDKCSGMSMPYCTVVYCSKKIPLQKYDPPREISIYEGHPEGLEAERQQSSNCGDLFEEVVNHSGIQWNV